MSTTQGIKLDDETRARLKALGATRQRSPHWLMKKAIEQYLEREERYEREKAEDLARLERYEATGEYIDGEIMEKLLQDLANGKPVEWPK